jgi:hypothetical protein
MHHQRHARIDIRKCIAHLTLNLGMTISAAPAKRVQFENTQVAGYRDMRYPNRFLAMRTYFAMQSKGQNI